MATIPTKDQRIETLARTLRTSGFALSDSQAKKMAQDMLDTEDRVQKRYQDQHEKAQSILRGGPPPETPLPKQVDKEQLKEHMVEEMRERAMGAPHEHKEHTDVAIAQRTVSEIVKEAEPAPRMKSPALADLDLVEEPAHPIEPLVTPVAPIAIEEEVQPAPAQPVQVADVPAVNAPEAEEKAATPAADDKEEEDPNQPEKTRVYTDKVKDPKPKEEYEENKVDLSDIFKVRK